MKRILKNDNSFKETETKTEDPLIKNISSNGNYAVYYECGSCKELTNLDEQDPIRCKQCGYRILYKQRSDIPSEYVAR